MNDFPGYARAQREYDNRTPPDDGPIECPECNGTGDVTDPADEEADGFKCLACDGLGHLSADGEPFDLHAAENDACDRADMQRDERMTNPPDAGDYE